MKIIVSHDVDHISVSEHLTDTIIPKFIARNFIELAKGFISPLEFAARFVKLFSNKWNGIDEVMQFNKSLNVNATFFVGVNNGLGLNYSLALAAASIKKIVDNQFDCGVHGIAFQHSQEINAEFQTFRDVSGLQEFGIRMHYLRQSEKTIDYIRDAGYLFDATTMGKIKPEKYGSLWLFPLNLMDGHIIEKSYRWQTQTLNQALDETKKQIENAMTLEIPYYSMLFHDRYFDKSFKTWMNWYVQSVEWLSKQGFSFVNYREAILEEENKILNNSIS